MEVCLNRIARALLCLAVAKSSNKNHRDIRHPLYHGQPVCTVDNPCTLKTQEAAEDFIKKHPGATVIVNPSVFDEAREEEENSNDDEEEDGEDNDGSGDGGVSNNEEDTVNEGSTSTPASGTNIMELAAIDHDGDGRTCLDQHRMADQANQQLEGLGMAPIGSGNIEEDLRACVEAELTPDADDVRRGQGLGPNAGPLPPNLANPPPDDGLTRLNPPGDLGGIFAGPGSTTNRPGL